MTDGGVPLRTLPAPVLAPGATVATDSLGGILPAGATAAYCCACWGAVCPMLLLACMADWPMAGDVLPAPAMEVVEALGDGPSAGDIPPASACGVPVPVAMPVPAPDLCAAPCAGE